MWEIQRARNRTTTADQSWPTLKSSFSLLQRLWSSRIMHFMLFHLVWIQLCSTIRITGCLACTQQQQQQKEWFIVLPWNRIRIEWREYWNQKQKKNKREKYKLSMLRLSVVGDIYPIYCCSMSSPCMLLCTMAFPFIVALHRCNLLGCNKYIDCLLFGTKSFAAVRCARHVHCCYTATQQIENGKRKKKQQQKIENSCPLKSQHHPPSRA